MNPIPQSETPALSPEAVAEPRAYADPAALDAMLARLRAEAPVVWVEPQGFRPFWLVTRYNDIMEVEAHTDLFLGEPRPVLLPIEQERHNLAAYGSLSGARTLVHMDEAGHAAYRGLTHSWFMGQNLQRLEGRVREIARGFVAGLREKGGVCDFARDVAYLYPLRIIMLILGLREEDEGLMLRLSEALMGPGSGAGLEEGLGEFAAFFTALARDRRANPRDDLSSVIANGQIDGRPITDEEAVSYFFIAATAGHDTTSAVTAGGMLALLQHPEQLAKLKAEPALLPSAIDEFVRWTTPVKHFMRTAAKDTALAGVAVAGGQSLMLHYQSANRDEDAYERPFELRIDRKPNRHLAFGYGPHKCLGRYLALMEVSAFYEALLPALDSIEAEGAPEFVPSYFVSGLKSLPVRYRMT